MHRPDALESGVQCKYIIALQLVVSTCTSVILPLDPLSLPPPPSPPPTRRRLPAMTNSMTSIEGWAWEWQGKGKGAKEDRCEMSAVCVALVTSLLYSP